MKLIIAITGASGSIYAQRLLQKLEALPKLEHSIAVIFSETGKKVWQYELGESPKHAFKEFDNSDFFAAPASGSALFETMIVCPCSMGTMGRIAAGLADSLICRAADVMLKERRKLIIVPRETPYSLIHIRNMETIALAGGIIIPASPSFYSSPKNINELVDTFVDRIMHHVGLGHAGFMWGNVIT